MRELPLSFSDEKGWVLDVPFALPASTLRAAAAWAYKINYDRFLCMPHGDRRDRAFKALELLRDGKVSQRVIARPHQEFAVFRAERGTGKIISQPGV